MYKHQDTPSLDGGLPRMSAPKRELRLRPHRPGRPDHRRRHRPRLRHGPLPGGGGRARRPRGPPGKRRTGACAELGARRVSRCAGDVTQLETAPALVEQAERLAGPLTALVNNAGVHLKKPRPGDNGDADFAAVHADPCVWRVCADPRGRAAPGGAQIRQRSVHRLDDVVHRHAAGRGVRSRQERLSRARAIPRGRVGAHGRARERHRTGLDRVGHAGARVERRSGAPRRRFLAGPRWPASATRTTSAGRRSIWPRPRRSS